MYGVTPPFLSHLYGVSHCMPRPGSRGEVRVQRALRCSGGRTRVFSLVDSERFRRAVLMAAPPSTISATCRLPRLAVRNLVRLTGFGPACIVPFAVAAAPPACAGV